MKFYDAIDKGDAIYTEKLDRLPVTKTLHLKIGEPVVLLQNIHTSSSVNEQRGTVKGMTNEHVVFFDGHKAATTLSWCIFSLHDPRIGIK